MQVENDEGGLIYMLGHLIEIRCQIWNF